MFDQFHTWKTNGFGKSLGYESLDAALRKFANENNWLSSYCQIIKIGWVVAEKQAFTFHTFKKRGMEMGQQNLQLKKFAIDAN